MPVIFESKRQEDCECKVSLGKTLFHKKNTRSTPDAVK
jgi:hypothetical protein